MPKTEKQPCVKCGAPRCSYECRMLVVARTSKKCPGCSLLVRVGEWARIAANPNVRGAYFLYHPRCHQALHPSVGLGVMNRERPDDSPVEPLLPAPT